MDYEQSLTQLREVDRELADELAEFGSLEKLLGWFRTKDLPLREIDLVAQDEYCHDLIIPFTDGRWLSFAMT